MQWPAPVARKCRRGIAYYGKRAWSLGVQCLSQRPEDDLGSPVDAAAGAKGEEVVTRVLIYHETCGGRVQGRAYVAWDWPNVKA
jgi:hypothetical protein